MASTGVKAAGVGGMLGLLLAPLLFAAVADTAEDARLAALASCTSSTGEAGGGGRNIGPDSTGRHGRYIDLPLREADQAAGVSVSDLAVDRWAYPVAPPLNLSTRFGLSGPHWSRGHTGVDFAKPAGTPVYAATSGIVLHVQHMAGSGSPAYGNYVLLLHADNVVTLYAHLSAVGPLREGQRIRTGDEIGRVGSTGNVTGPHLHFEVRPMIGGRHLPVDPEPYLANAGTVRPKELEDQSLDVPAAIECTLGGGPGGAVYGAALPALARRMAPTVARLQSSLCPELPQVWIYAEVQAESSWNPQAWTYDSNGGAAGLYQMARPAWIAATGSDGGWPIGSKPYRNHHIWMPEKNLKAGITYTCGNLRQMTAYLARRPEKKVTPLDAMAICHVAGCGRVTDSRTGVPTPGEAGCGHQCVHTIRTYLENIHRWVTAYGAGPTAPLGKAGPIPVAVRLPGHPAPYRGGSNACTAPDPTGGRCLTGPTAHGLAEILRKWPRPAWQSIGCQQPRTDGGEHPLGRACDLAPGPIGSRPNARQLSTGWALAGWLRRHSVALRVEYVIWQGRIWSVRRPEDQDGGWGRAYDNGLNDPNTLTGGHYDHLHVTFRQ